MSLLRNYNWYAKNETRSYPLDDAATLLDDSGKLLPHNLLVDMFLRFPGTYGKRAFLSSLTVSPSLVTLTFQGNAAGFQPLAVISLPRPITPYQQIPVTPYASGISGWLVLGGGVEELLQTVSYRFSTPAQGLLLARAAWHYRLQPSRGISKEGTSEVLRGLIRFSGGSDLFTSRQSVEIGGTTYQAVGISLRDDAEGSERNLLQEYAGECGRRPESRSCREPQPIEFINDVGPDCCGDLYIEFRGCAEPYQITNGNGVVVSCDFGLAGACITPSRLPGPDGQLPNEYPDLCEPEAQPASLDEVEPPVPVLLSAAPAQVLAKAPITELIDLEEHGQILESVDLGNGSTWLRTNRRHGLRPGDYLVLPAPYTPRQSLVTEALDPYELVVAATFEQEVKNVTWLNQQVLESQVIHTDPATHLRLPLASFQAGVIYSATLTLPTATRSLGSGLYVGSSGKGTYYAACLSIGQDPKQRTLAIYRLANQQARLMAATVLPLEPGRRYRLRLEAVTAPDRLFATVLPLDDEVVGQVQVQLREGLAGDAGLFSPYNLTFFKDWNLRVD